MPWLYFLLSHFFDENRDFLFPFCLLALPIVGCTLFPYHCFFWKECAFYSLFYWVWVFVFVCTLFYRELVIFCYFLCVLWLFYICAKCFSWVCHLKCVYYNLWEFLCSFKIWGALMEFGMRLYMPNVLYLFLSFVSKCFVMKNTKRENCWVSFCMLAIFIIKALSCNSC